MLQTCSFFYTPKQVMDRPKLWVMPQKYQTMLDIMKLSKNLEYVSFLMPQQNGNWFCWPVWGWNFLPFPDIGMLSLSLSLAVHWCLLPRFFVLNFLSCHSTRHPWPKWAVKSGQFSPLLPECPPAWMPRWPTFFPCPDSNRKISFFSAKWKSWKSGRKHQKTFGEIVLHARWLFIIKACCAKSLYSTFFPSYHELLPFPFLPQCLRENQREKERCPGEIFAQPTFFQINLQPWGGKKCTLHDETLKGTQFLSLLSRTPNFAMYEPGNRKAIPYFCWWTMHVYV